MSIFNDNKELEHPAFHDEDIRKQQTWVGLWISCLLFLIELGFAALILFCIWILIF